MNPSRLTKIKPTTFSIFLTFLLFALIIGDSFYRNSPLYAKTSTTPQGIFVPIIMYHSVNKDDTLANDYVITPIELEKDIVYLTQQGYTPVFVQDLIDYVYIDSPLPEKPVVLTFDDGFSDNLQNVLPLLEKYDFKATISVVGKFSKSASDLETSQNYSAYLNFSEISQLINSCHVEIANHTYDLHSLSPRKGCAIMNGETFENYRNTLISDLNNTQNLLRENCKIVPSVFTYPYGFVSEPSLRIVKSLGFKASLGVEEKPNFITKSPDCLYNLNRYNRPHGISTEEFFKKVLKA